MHKFSRSSNREPDSSAFCRAAQRFRFILTTVTFSGCLSLSLCHMRKMSSLRRFISHGVDLFSWFRSRVTHLILERKSYIAHNVPLVHCTSDWILQLCNNWPSQLITCWLKPISSCPNPSQPSQTIPTHPRASQIRQLQLDLILTLGLDAEVHAPLESQSINLSIRTVPNRVSNNIAPVPNPKQSQPTPPTSSQNQNLTHLKFDYIFKIL